MARVTSVSNGFFDSILPTYGTQRTQTPVWNESLKMFIIDEYESANGNRYYNGVRISNRIVIVEHIGLYHTFTYLDGLDIYMFDGEQRKLIVQEKYDKQFYDVNFIREVSKQALRNYAYSQAAMTGTQISENMINIEVDAIIDNSYQSLLSDDKLQKLQNIMPILNKALKRA
ncbi:MAG: hypothetical protein ACI392_07160 [Paludibacteraceae bacterium]